MTDHIKIAVISDLHIGEMAKGKDFSPLNNENASVENYMEHFIAFVDQSSLQADYLLVTGDISNKADQNEFVLASTLITKIAATLKIPEQNIIFCPGNHDMHWGAAEAAKALPGSNDKLVIKAKHASLMTKGLIFSNNLKKTKGAFDEYPFVALWEMDDINVFALNSAVYDEHDNRPHRGEIKNDQLEALDELISSNIKKEKINIFILHHHPKPYQDKTFREGDFSGIINADGLLHLLSRHSIDFVVHGHKHIPRFDLEINSEGNPIWILCAGSFSSRLDDRHFEGVGNFFHMIEFHDRCKSSGWARGHLNSWVHLLAHKWKESGTIDFDSQNQFGEYQRPDILRDLLQTSISNILKQPGLAHWRDLVNAYPAIQYYPNKMLRKEIEAISKNLGLTVTYRSREQNFSSLVLLKEI